MKIFHKILDFFWPHFTDEPPIYSNYLDTTIINNIKDPETALKFAEKMLDNQRNRISSIESKSIVFIGLFSSVIAIFVFIIRDLLSSENNHISYAIVLILAILILYASQVLRYSIKALERRKYNQFNETSFLDKNKKEVIFELINCVKSNYDEINLKVDYMTLAQLFVHKIILIFTLSSIFIIAYSVYQIMDLNMLMSILEKIESNFRIILLIELTFFIVIAIWIISLIIKINRTHGE